MQLTAKQIMAALRVNIGIDRSTFIHGSVGIGKSQIVRQIAAEFKMEIITIHLNLRESVDLRGLPMIDKTTGQTKWLPPAELPTKGKGLLFLDEMTSGTSLSLQASAMSLVLDRQVGEYRLPKGWVPIAAGNRMVDKAATQRMGTALSNRFSHFEMVPNADDWVAWAVKNDISPYITGFIRRDPAKLHKMPTSSEQHAFPTPRTWEFSNDYMDITDHNLRYNMLASVLGEGAATELEGFIEQSKNLPELEYIFSSPKRAPIPDQDQPSAMFFIAQSLAQNVTTKNFGAAIEYTGRLPKEHQIAMVMDAVTRDRALMNTRAYTNWCVDNEEIVVG